MAIRDSSSIILVSNGEFYPQHEIRLLTVIRSDRSSHYPGACVFPGGNVDKSDKSRDWLDVIPESEINYSFKIVDSLGREINDKTLLTDEISTVLFLKICAIRETFEECGILLCKKYINDNCNQVSHLEIPEIHLWRKKIRENANEFFTLCQINNCYPDVNNLYLWSNWCSPTYLERRYNTKYFLAVTTTEPASEPDNEEITVTQWKTVEEYLFENESDLTFLPPPQFYELCRMKQFRSVQSLLEFANANLKDSYCQQYMAQQVNAKNGVIILLPGDEKYEYYLKMRPIIMDINENIEDCEDSVMHRIIIRHNGKYRCDLIIKNYNSPINHLSPKSIISKL